MKLLEKLAISQVSTVQHTPATLGFLGDSITNGVFEVYPCRYPNGEFTIRDVCRQDECYVAHLKKLLNLLYSKAQLNIINAGISGDNAPNAVNRVERDLLAFHPDLTVVCFGMNDMYFGMEKLPQFKAAMENIVEQIKSADCDVIVMTPPMPAIYHHPLVTSPEFGEMADHYAKIWNDGTVHAYMDAIRQVAAEENVALYDCFAKWERLHKAGVDTTNLLANHINHPVRELHPMIANGLFDVILEM